MAVVIPLLHERLPALRRTRKLSQNGLAELCPGVSLDTIRKYEGKRGAGRVPEVEILEELAAALAMPAEKAFYEYPIALARRAARPGVSQRRRVATPSDELVDEVEDAGQKRDRQQPSPAPASTRKQGSGRAA